MPGPTLSTVPTLSGIPTLSALSSLSLSLLALILPGVAFAHPGHALHYLIDPTQGGMLPVAVVLGAGVLAWLLGNRRPRPAPARKPESKDGRSRKPRS